MQYHLSPKHILTSCGTHIASNHASTTAVIYFANKWTLTRLNLIISKIFTILHHLYCCYVYIPSTTCLHIPLAHPCLYYYLLSPQYIVLHILFYCIFYSLFFLIIFYLYLCLSSCVVLHIFHCPLSGPDLTYISLLIIFCIIEYVTNLEPWTLKSNSASKCINEMIIIKDEMTSFL